MHCTKISAKFEFGGHSPLSAQPQKCGDGLRRWENQRIKLSSYEIISAFVNFRLNNNFSSARGNLPKIISKQFYFTRIHSVTITAYTDVARLNKLSVRIDSALVSMNEVTLRRARLVVGWVTVSEGVQLQAQETYLSI